MKTLDEHVFGRSFCPTCLDDTHLRHMCHFTGHLAGSDMSVDDQCAMNGNKQLKDIYGQCLLIVADKLIDGPRA